jgi:ethanolamine kinase
MSESDIRILDVTAGTDDPEAEGYHILEMIRPEWKREDIEIKIFTEGYINHMMRFNLKSDVKKDNAIIVRIFGTIKIAGEKIDIETDLQVMAMQMAAQLGIAQPVYAVFKNGMVYRYGQGHTLTGEDVQNPKVIRLICRALARFHNAKWESTKLFKINGDKGCVDKKITIVLSGMIDKITEQTPEKLSNPVDEERRKAVFPPKQEFIDQRSRARKRMDDVIPMTMQHNDCHIKNMVYNPDKDELSLLDYECVGLYWRGGDIARVLCMCLMWKGAGFTDKEYHFEHEAMLPYARAYLEETNIFLGKSPDDVTELEVETLYWEIKMCWVYSDLIMAGMISFAPSDTSFEIDAKKDFTAIDHVSIGIESYKRFVADMDFFFNSSPPT